MQVDRRGATLSSLETLASRAGREYARLAACVRPEDAPNWLLGGLVAVATWGPQLGIPSVGLDASWPAGLYLAVDRGLEFGSDVVFTYGPLGFLVTPVVWQNGLAILSFCHAAVLYVALAWALVSALRSSFGPLGAAAVAFLALALLPSIEYAVALAVLVSLWMLSADRSARECAAFVVGGASFAAVESLVKLSTGPVVLAAIVVALVGMRASWPALGAFAGIFGAELVGLWLASGQALSGIPDFVSNTFQVIGGYSEAMSVSLAPRWQVPAELAVLLVLVGASALVPYRDRRARISAVAIVALAGFLLFKEGVVRFESSHVGLFFSTACLLWLAIPWPRARRTLLAVGAAAIAALAIYVAPSARSGGFDVIANVRLTVGQLKNVFSHSRRERIAAAGRGEMRRVYRIDPATLAALRGHRVSVEPWEVGAAWAYDLDWSPVPVFQNHTAYTEDLDLINTAEIQSASGPERILRENPALVDPEYPTRTIDARYPGWDPPAQARAELCHFAPVRTTERWQVLARVPDRCGAPRPAGTVEAAFDDEVSVPAPRRGEVVFAHIEGAEVDGLERVRSFFFRPSYRYVVVNGQDSYRLVPGAAANGLLLRGTDDVPPNSPFSQVPQARTIELTGRGGPLRFRFFRMPLRTGAAPTADGGD